MSTTPKRDREQQQQQGEEQRQKSKKAVISLLDRCLTSHCLQADRHKEIIISASKALALNPTILAASDEDESDSEPPVSKSGKKAQSQEDGHDVVCDVCENGGDLLCCDTCSLVFHLKCVRPKLAAVPRGRWSCAQCILDGLGTGSLSSAKVAVRRMSRLSRGVDSEDEGDVNAGRIMKTGDITVVRSGRRFIVRKNTRSQIVELGRYDTLESALSSLLPASVNEEALWCVYCLDDPGIMLCAFCGCRRCFGKHDSHLLLTCEGCNEHTHTYCLNPPLSAIPEENWYCAPCIRLGKSIVGKAEDADGDESITGSMDYDGDMGDHDEPYNELDEKRSDLRRRGSDSSFSGGRSFDNSSSVPGKRRGRPPGSGKRLKDSGDRGGCSGSGEEGLFVAGSPIMPVIISDDLKRSGSISSLPKDEAVTVPSTVEAAGIDGALAIISRLGKRELSKTESSLLEQLRAWAPKQDLEAALEALTLQRDALLSKIAAIGSLSSPDTDNIVM